MNAIEMLVDDHREVEKLFADYERLGDRAKATRRKTVDRIIKELSIHSAVEEQVFYPAVRELDDEVDRHVLESLEEHHVMKWVLSELDGLDPAHERFHAKVTVLIENVRHHVEEEEKEFFPRVKRHVDKQFLADLGEAIKEAKKVAPTRPHPKAPDEPPGNVVGGMVLALVDRAREAGKAAMAGSPGGGDPAVPVYPAKSRQRRSTCGRRPKRRGSWAAG